MKVVSPEFSAHIQEEVTTLSSCWRIERRDGAVLCFTDHDEDIVFEGRTYLASAGFSRTQLALNSNLSVDAAECIGILDNYHITIEDLRAGKYNYAHVYLFMVNWADPSMGALKLRSGWLGETTLKGGTYQVELRGMNQAFARTLCELYTPDCRADFGDSRCRVNMVVGNNPISITANIFGIAIRRYEGVVTANVSTDPSSVGISVGKVVVVADVSDSSFNGQFDVTSVTSVGGNWEITWAQVGASAISWNGTVSVATSKMEWSATVASASNRKIFTINETIGNPPPNAYDAAVPTPVLSLIPYTPQAGYAYFAAGTTVYVKMCLRNGIGSTLMGAAASITTVEPHQIVRAFCPGLSDWMMNLPAPFKPIGWDMYFCADPGTPLDSQYLRANEIDSPEGSPAPLEQGISVSWWPTAFQIANYWWPSVRPNGTRPPTADSAFISTYGGTGFFNAGLVTFNSGKNAGMSMEVKLWEAAEKRATLFLAMPFAIQAGDSVTIRTGCNKTLQDCMKYANVVNFRGEPFVPGEDLTRTYPNAH